jgi:hypothetical protein
LTLGTRDGALTYRPDGVDPVVARPRTRKSEVRDGVRVSWDQVAAFRLGRHHLTERAPARALGTVVADMGGAQAQVLAAAQLALWARVRDLNPDELDRALWTKRSLAKAWCMRQTLYLLPSNELAMFVRGSARRAEKEIRWMLNHGVSEPTLGRVLDATLAALGEPVTRTELAQKVGITLGLPFRWGQGGGWGSDRRIPCVQIGEVTCPSYYLLHLVGARGVVCSGPNRGSEATFVRGDAWVRRWHDLSRERAEGGLLRRYLGAFGPGTVADFVAWTRMLVSDAEEIWTREESAFVSVDVEGWPAQLLRRDLAELQAAELDPPSVRLLPYFDSYLLGHMKRGHLLETKDHRRVYRDQGWVAPVVLVDGRVTGVWSHRRKGERLLVRVEPFAAMPSVVRTHIREEAVDLGRFRGCSRVETSWA